MQLNLPLSNDNIKADPLGDIPHIIKYMGSKKPIIEFVTNTIESVHKPEVPVCDLFAGSCSVSAALRRKFDFISNDIQSYSAVLAHTYFSNLSGFEADELLEQIVREARVHSFSLQQNYSALLVDFGTINDLNSFYEIETKQRSLIYQPFLSEDYFLFTKFYSGTYWSFEQCVWIDSLRKAAESFKDTEVYYPIISSIMYAMSYTTQSTGHFAQYRDGRTEEAMQNILFYRQKNLVELFRKKFRDLIKRLNNSLKSVTTTTQDFTSCLKNLPPETTVYADPPYAPVHYSRFYHALETLVQYDYPEVEFKGRYRKDRHQSPFSQKSNAESAFTSLFEGIVNKKAQLLLSYSDAGVLSIDKIYGLAEMQFPRKMYTLECLELNHAHSTMGRFEDSKRDVVEHLIVAKHK